MGKTLGGVRGSPRPWEWNGEKQFPVLHREEGGGTCHSPKPTLKELDIVWGDAPQMFGILFDMMRDMMRERENYRVWSLETTCVTPT